MQPFDLQRIFLGDLPWTFLVEIAFRTVILYIYTLGILRLIGQRGMERLSSFDFAIVIAMGSAVGDPMFYPEVPLLHGMMVVTTILAVERGLSWITKRSQRAERTLEGVTMRVVKEGCIEPDFLQKSMLSREELFMKLREAGARQMGEVEAAYLELDGLYSVFLAPPGQASPGLPIVPPWDVAPPPLYPTGQPAPRDGVYACAGCGETQTLSAGERFPACPRCEGAQWTHAVVPERQ